MLCYRQDSLLLTGPRTIHKFIIELHVLQCLFARGSNKKQRRIRLFQISQKERLFISDDNQLLLWIISQCPPPLLASSKKGLPFSFTPFSFILAKKKTYLDTQLKGKFADLFRKLLGCILFPQE